MIIQQIYTKCLSEASYYIESNGEAVIIDPIRDIDQYVDLIEQDNVTLKYIFETHVHADFISGHLDLSRKYNTPIVYGPNSKTEFDIHQAKDEEIFSVGEITIQVLHTPGHTLESSCFLLKDKEGKNHAIFTGDTLFIGDVGRPDLMGGNATKEELAGLMFDSLNKRIKPLEDHIIVYPAHGPGSACGKSLGKETFSTIGVQKMTNYALQPMTEIEFVDVVTDGLQDPPAYFPMAAKMNKSNYTPLEDVLNKSLTPIKPETISQKVEDGVLILDTRHQDVFVEGFVPSSIFIGINGRFAEWVGGLLPSDKDIILVCEAGKEKEAVTRMARVGFENVIGYIDGGFDGWKNANLDIDMIINIETDEMAMDLKFDEAIRVIDVRKENEFKAGKVKNALNIPLTHDIDISAHHHLDEEEQLYVHCKSGYRSVIAASILKKNEFHNIRNIVGGFDKIVKTEGIKTVLKKEVKSCSI